MTTGSRGPHVIVRLDRGIGFDQVRAFARDVADHLAAQHPDELTREARRAKRGGRLYLDTARNAYAQTAVAPFAVRALPGAPVAAPIEWSQLGDRELNGRSYSTKRPPEPWAEGVGRVRSLTAAHRRLTGRGAR